MNRKRLITAAALVGIAGLGLTVLMAAREPGDKPPESPGKPAANGKKLVCYGTVDTEEPVVKILPDNFPMTSKVTGVLVKEGDLVTKGQPLLEFDTKALALKVQEAEKSIDIAKAAMTRADATIRTHAVQVKSLEKDYQAKEEELKSKKKDLEEAQRLRDIGAINQLTLDAHKSAVKAADFNLESARIKWEGLRDESPTYLKDEAEKNIKKAENAKAQAEHALSQVSCNAPADGRILRSYASEGLTFGPHTRDPAFWFLKKGPLVVRAEVTQEFASRVVKGQSATIVDEADAKQTWKGKVVKVPDQFLPKRLGNTGLVDLMPVNDERVLECQVSIELAPGEVPPRFGQKVRVTLPE